MKKFINNLKRYNPYAFYAAKSELKGEVAGSYLTWLWWILDPLFFMLIYTFIVQIVFATSVQNLPVFVMCGIIIWDFFNKNLITSVRIIRSNKGIITQKYIPKYMLVIEKLYVNFIKFLISFVLLAVMAIIFKIQITINILYAIPIIGLLSLISFGLSTILSHFGVFIEDAANIVQIILRLVFYLSGIFYSITERLPGTLSNIMMRINPVAYMIEDFRNVFMYGKGMNFELFFYWLIITLLVVIVAIKLINKYENSYAKVM